MTVLRFFQLKADWVHTTCTTMLGKDTTICLVASKGLINHLIICNQTYSKVTCNSSQHTSSVHRLNPSLWSLWMGWKFKGLPLTKAEKKSPPLFVCISYSNESREWQQKETRWITHISKNSHGKWKMMTKLEPSVSECWNPGIGQWITLTCLWFLQKTRVCCSFYYLLQGLIC